MQLATFLGLLAASATAIVCPPQMTEAALALKLEGEACGGACQADGSCAEGLECQKPKTSPFSFAILAPSPAGVCQKPKTVTHMMGGVSDIGLDDEGVQDAAKFGVDHIQKTSNGLALPTLDRIVSAQKQVVVSNTE